MFSDLFQVKHIATRIYYEISRRPEKHSPEKIKEKKAT